MHLKADTTCVYIHIGSRALHLLVVTDERDIVLVQVDILIDELAGHEADLDAEG